MRYLIMIYANEASRAAWERFSDAERSQGLAAYKALNDDTCCT